MSLELLGGLKSVARFCSGMWGYLTERVKGRTAVQLEQERNQATAEAIRLLPPGAELFENEPNGRTRIIRMPHHTANPLLINVTEAPPTATPLSAAPEHEPLAITAPPTTPNPAPTDAPPTGAPSDAPSAPGREQQQ
jgi:hypothetical protein